MLLTMASTQTAKGVVVLSSFGGLMQNNLVKSYSLWIFFAAGYA
jgi:hypothetical protein